MHKGYGRHFTYVCTSIISLIKFNYSIYNCIVHFIMKASIRSHSHRSKSPEVYIFICILLLYMLYIGSQRFGEYELISSTSVTYMHRTHKMNDKSHCSSQCGTMVSQFPTFPKTTVFLSKKFPQ